MRRGFVWKLRLMALVGAARPAKPAVWVRPGRKSWRRTPAAATYRPGDRVTVAITRRTGAVAVLLAYVVPFVVLIGVVAVCYLLGAGDGAAGLAGLGSVVLYYGILWLLRRKIDNAIHFTISE